MLKKTVVAMAMASAAFATGAHAQEGRWDGVYIGGHGAFADGTVHDKNNPAASKQDIDGWQGGVQAGINKQNGSFLFGIEADATFGKSDKKWLDRDTGGSPFSTYYGTDSIRTSGTVRARAGWAGEQALVYLTGGLAIADTKHGLGCEGAINPAATGRCLGDGSRDFYTEESKTRLGYVVGGGVELALNESISIKGEYNYVDYGKKTVTLVDPITPVVSGDRRFGIKTNLYKVGVNFRF